MVRHSVRGRRALALVAAAATLLGATGAGVAPSATAQGFGTNPYARLKPPADTGALHVVRAAPKGQLRSSGQASELRWVFDRPVVELTSIDQRPDVSGNVTITPSVAGAFRWASTRTLVFTPSKRLPRSTRFTAEVKGLTAQDGTKLASPYRTTFDTPRVSCALAGTDDRVRSIAIRCDQPVDGKNVAEHVRLRPRQQEVDLAPFRLSAEARARLQAKDRPSLDRLDAVLARLGRGAVDLGETPVTFERTAACPDDDRRSCLWMVPRVPLVRDANVEVAFLDGIASKEGPLTSTGVSSGSFPTPETPLVGLECTSPCILPADGFRLVTRGSFDPAAFDGKLTVREVGGQGTWTYRVPSGDADRYDPLSLLWAKVEPRRTYEVEVDPSVVSSDGLTIGVRLLARVTFGGRVASLTARDGEVVREIGQGRNVPIGVRNVTKADVIVQPVGPERIASLRTALRDGTDQGRARLVAQFQASSVELPRKVDAAQTYPIAVPGPGAYLVGVRATAFESQSEYASRPDLTTDAKRWHLSLVQVTDTAITIKKSATNVLVGTTSLTTGKPLGGVPVQLQDGTGTGAVLWTGATDKDGFVFAPTPPALADGGDLLVLGGGQGGTAYASSTWGTNGGPVPYFEGRTDAVAPPSASIGKVAGGPTGTPTDQTTSTLPVPKLAQGESYVGTAFADRGVYRPGEEVHVRGQIRVQAPRALHLPPAIGTAAVTVRDDRGETVKEQTVPVDGRGGWELAFTLPSDARHGTYEVVTFAASASFLVTEFRRPDFQVDVALDHPDPAEYVSGDTVKGTASGQYLFGEPMRGQASAWTLTEDTSSFDPTAKHPELGLQGYSWDPVCVWYQRCSSWGRGELAKGSGKLDDAGRLAMAQALAVRTDAHGPTQITLEATVTNVDRQVIANRATAVVHPGEVYVGVKSSTYFGQKGKPVQLSAAALTPAGAWKPGVSLTARLIRWDWDWASAQDQGPKSTEVASVALTSASAAVPFSLTPDKAGQYEVRVEATDARGNHVESGTYLYVLGPGVTVGQDRAEVEVVPQRDEYRPGETAHVLLRSPFPGAEAMVTVDGRDVRSAQRITFTGSAASVDVPVTEDMVPYVSVSVVVFKPRTAGEATDSDPAVKVGTMQLRVLRVRQRLAVAVTPDAATYRPGAASTATVRVADADGRPAAGRVSLWAVDEGVLRLTDYQLPDLLEAIGTVPPFLPTADSRARLSTPAEDALLAKSADRAAGGAAFAASEAAPQPAFTDGPAEAAPEGEVRTDLRILATWQGSLTVPASGVVTSRFTLPQSLTSYRLLAVADSGDDRFGGGTAVVQVRKPLMVQPALPRFASLGDTFEAGAVIQNQTGSPGAATVTLELPAGSPVTVDGPATKTLSLAAGPTEVRFRLKATGLGDVQGVLRAKLGAESDAVQVGFPVLITRRAEAVAASGVVEAGGKPDVEQLRLPGAVYPDLGGLDLTVSSSALAGLDSGIAELVEYPYGCLEQRSSRLRVLLMLQDLKQTFPIPALGQQDLRTAIVAELARIAEYRTSDGGLSYWPGDDVADVFLSARVLVLLLDARDLGYAPPPGIVDDLVQYLRTVLDESDARRVTRPTVDRTGLWYNRAHVLYALARAGQPELQRAIALWNRRENLSVLEQIHLVHALVLSGDTSTRPSVLLGELENGLRVEADQAFLQDEVAYDDSSTCPCLAYLFPDEGAAPHDTAELLSLLVKVDPKDPAAGQMARWLLAQRNRRGTWSNTLEDGYALTALVTYYKAAEATAPDFSAKVLVGAVTAFQGTFSGRSLAIQAAQVPMATLAQAVGDPSKPVPLTVSAAGASGRLYWSARLRYAPSAPSLPAQSSGFTVTREYLPVTGGQEGAATTTFAAGALVRVRLRVTTAQARRNVVIDDALPAGLEALNPDLASTARTETAGTGEAPTWAPGIDHVELHDERVLLFATALRPGTLTYTYTARATAPGTFTVAPAQAEEMYRPELFGRTATATVTVTP